MEGHLKVFQFPEYLIIVEGQLQGRFQNAQTVSKESCGALAVHKGAIKIYCARNLNDKASSSK